MTAVQRLVQVLLRTLLFEDLMFLVANALVPSSVLAPSSDARSP